MAAGSPVFLTLSAQTFTLIDPGGDITLTAPGSRQLTISSGAGATTVNNGNLRFGGIPLSGGGIQFTASGAPFGANGDFWQDTTQKCIMFQANGVKEYTTRSMFVQTADATVGNTVAETALTGTGIGTLTFSTNFFVIGKSFRVRAYGIIASAGANLTIKVKLGSTIMAATAADATGAITGTTNWALDCMLTCRTTGASSTSKTVGKFDFFTTGILAGAFDLTDQGSTFDSTATQALSVTAQWGTGAPAETLTCNNLVVETIA